MDRLISEQELLKHFDPVENWVVVQTIKAIPPAEPYKGMTNGGVLCTMFPSLHYTLSDNGRIVTTIGVVSSFDKEWWDSPYEPQERSEK